MAFQVPESKRSIGQNEYSYTIGDKTYTVTAAKFMTGFQLEAVLSGNLSVIYDVFGEKDTPHGDAVRGLDLEQFEALVSDWAGSDGLNLGE